MIWMINELKNSYKFFRNIICKVTIYDIKKDFEKNLVKLNNEYLVLSCNNSLYNQKEITNIKRKIFVNEKIIDFIDKLIDNKILGW